MPSYSLQAGPPFGHTPTSSAALDSAQPSTASASTSSGQPKFQAQITATRLPRHPSTASPPRRTRALRAQPLLHQSLLFKATELAQAKKTLKALDITPTQNNTLYYGYELLEFFRKNERDTDAINSFDKAKNAIQRFKEVGLSDNAAIKLLLHRDMEKFLDILKNSETRLSIKKTIQTINEVGLRDTATRDAAMIELLLNENNKTFLDALKDPKALSSIKNILQTTRDVGLSDCAALDLLLHEGNEKFLDELMDPKNRRSIKKTIQMIQEVGLDDCTTVELLLDENNDVFLAALKDPEALSSIKTIFWTTRDVGLSDCAALDLLLYEGSEKFLGKLMNPKNRRSIQQAIDALKAAKFSEYAVLHFAIQPNSDKFLPILKRVAQTLKKASDFEEDFLIERIKSFKDPGDLLTFSDVCDRFETINCDKHFKLRLAHNIEDPLALSQALQIFNDKRGAILLEKYNHNCLLNFAVKPEYLKILGEVNLDLQELYAQFSHVFENITGFNTTSWKELLSHYNDNPKFRLALTSVADSFAQRIRLKQEDPSKSLAAIAKTTRDPKIKLTLRAMKVIIDKKKKHSA